MKITYSEELRDYLRAQKHRDILISTFKPKGCATLPEHDIRLLKPEEADELIQKETPCINGELGRVFITRAWLPEDQEATIHLDLKKFLGSKSIRAEGLKVWEAYF